MGGRREPERGELSTVSEKRVSGEGGITAIFIIALIQRIDSVTISSS